MPPGKKAASKMRSADFGDPCHGRPTSQLSLSKTCGGSHDAITRPQDNVLTSGLPLRSSLNTCCTSNVNPPSHLRGNDGREQTGFPYSRDGPKGNSYFRLGRTGRVADGERRGVRSQLLPRTKTQRHRASCPCSVRLSLWPSALVAQRDFKATPTRPTLFSHRSPVYGVAA